ncbi:hypothetical protein [Arthrobacter sp. B0490]|uniref:hypothetical protein n=1 Tax=Arthrobacter sp. B0490 TaxID=2058891 RepID=UPI000CE47F0A|nr:hypothetical protein [Arthrobacter sp. B0490]
MPHTGGNTEDGRHGIEDSLRVPFWIVLAGVGVGAFWALAGVTVGAAVARRRGTGGRIGRPARTAGPPWMVRRR